MDVGHGGANGTVPVGTRRIRSRRHRPARPVTDYPSTDAGATAPAARRTQDGATAAASSVVQPPGRAPRDPAGPPSARARSCTWRTTHTPAHPVVGSESSHPMSTLSTPPPTWHGADRCQPSPPPASVRLAPSSLTPHPPSATRPPGPLPHPVNTPTRPAAGTTPAVHDSRATRPPHSTARAAPSSHVLHSLIVASATIGTVERAHHAPRPPNPPPEPRAARTTSRTLA